VFTKWLDYLSTTRELSATLRANATGSIKDITDILYERRTRGVLLASSIQRMANMQKFTERKEAYDNIFVKYNSNMQSDIFRLNEFSSSQYPFLGIRNDAVSLLLPSQLFSFINKCLIQAADSYLSSDQETRQQAPLLLTKCDNGSKIPATIEGLNAKVQDCIHEFTATLYGMISFSGTKSELRNLLEAGKRGLVVNCNPNMKT
jgi:hypothetical protein